MKPTLVVLAQIIRTLPLGLASFLAGLAVFVASFVVDNAGLQPNQMLVGIFGAIATFLIEYSHRYYPTNNALNQAVQIVENAVPETKQLIDSVPNPTTVTLSSIMPNPTPTPITDNNQAAVSDTNQKGA
jgi:hypothetical protein